MWSFVNNCNQRIIIFNVHLTKNDVNFTMQNNVSRTKTWELFLSLVWDEDPTNQKEERKLNDTYLGGEETWGEKGKKEIKNDTSIGGNGKEKTEEIKI